MKAPNKLYFVLLIYIFTFKLPLSAQFSANISINLNSQTFPSFDDALDPLRVVGKHLSIVEVDFMFKNGSSI